MTEREKVIKGLECCLNTSEFEECTENCPYCTKELGEGVCSENMMRDALSLLKAQEPNWISVDERLPERGIMVLTAIYGTDVIMPMDGETMEEAVERCLHRPARVSIGFVDQDGYWCGADGWPEVIQPKYWMEMPEPPKEE